MEFSILIPVYNQSIDSLCKSLHEQASSLSSNFQILFIDDCSELSISYMNMKVKQLSGVEYEVLTENIGRAAIRNKLFELAKHEFCIVMDGDVSILSSSFIQNYLDQAKENTVLVGGHTYDANPPRDKDFLLHWIYGTKVESAPAAQRNAHPYSSFMTSNFACYQSTFEKIKFDENLTQYGHEDTLFGIIAEEQNVAISHIENPVRHDGLDSSKDFLQKQKMAVQNLKYLYEKPIYRSKLAKHSALIQASKWPIPHFLLKLAFPFVSKNLIGNNPKIWCLQWQKLIWWKEAC